MLAIDLLVGAGLFDGELSGFLVVRAAGFERARAAVVELVDGGAQVILELLLVESVRKHRQIDVLVQVDRVGRGGGVGLAAERFNQANGPDEGLVVGDDLFCCRLAVDDGFIGFGLVGPTKFVARDGELKVLPGRVHLGGGRRGVGERDVDAGDGRVGVGDLRERHDAHDIDNDDEAQDDEERRLFAGLFVRPVLVCRGAVARMRWTLVGGIATCRALLIGLVLLMLLVGLLLMLRGASSRALLLGVRGRDGARRLDAAGLPAGLLRIGNQLSAVVLRHRLHILRVSPCGSSCFIWACIIAITLLIVVWKQWHSKEVGQMSHL